MTEDQTTSDSASSIEQGRAVYDDDGNELGEISGFTDEGFEVAINEDLDHVENDTDQDSVQEHEPGQAFGEGYLMWRCENCGEMGDLDDGLPTECPNCRSENVIKWRED